MVVIFVESVLDCFVVCSGYYVVVFSEIDKKTFRLALSDEQAEIVFE